MESYHQGSLSMGEHITGNMGEAPRRQHGSKATPHSCTNQSWWQEEGSMQWHITNTAGCSLQGGTERGGGMKEGKEKLVRI